MFTKGKFVLLGSWPGWLLVLLIVIAAAGIAWLIQQRTAEAAPLLQTWRRWVVWALEAAFVALVLLLLWRPAISISELKSQQNIIAVVVDDSRSMAIADSGADGAATREAAAVSVLQGGVLDGLRKKFQVRLYRLDGAVGRAAKVEEFKAGAAATHLGDGLKQIAMETSDLPVGAVVLLSDGSENAGGIENDAIAALRNRRLPVHTIGFGRESSRHDVEVDDAVLATRAMANARMSAAVSFHQHGYAGQKTTLIVKDGDKAIASKDVTLAGGWRGADGDGLLQRGPGSGEEYRLFPWAVGERGQCCEQRGEPAAGCEWSDAADSVCGGRAAVGVQVHPAGGAGRCAGAGGEHVAHDGEQDLPAGDQRSE